jgi:hypothetical protein
MLPRTYPPSHALLVIGRLIPMTFGIRDFQLHIFSKKRRLHLRKLYCSSSDMVRIIKEVKGFYGVEIEQSFCIPDFAADCRAFSRLTFASQVMPNRLHVGLCLIH